MAEDGVKKNEGPVPCRAWSGCYCIMLRMRSVRNEKFGIVTAYSLMSQDQKDLYYNSRYH